MILLIYFMLITKFEPQKKIRENCSLNRVRRTSLPNSAFSDPTVALARSTFEHSIEFFEIRSWTQNSRREINQLGIDSVGTRLIDKHAIITPIGKAKQSLSDRFYRDGPTRSGLLVRKATWTGLVNEHQFGFDSLRWHWSFSSTTLVRSWQKTTALVNICSSPAISDPTFHCLSTISDKPRKQTCTNMANNKRVELIQHTHAGI